MTGYGDLPRRIRLGEDSALELKQISVVGSRVIAPRRDDVANELGAFANGRGGDLVLGVDDTTREVAGIPLDALDAVEAWVREICHDVLKPPLDATIRKIELANPAGDLVPVLLVGVERSLFVTRVRAAISAGWAARSASWLQICWRGCSRNAARAG